MSVIIVLFIVLAAISVIVLLCMSAESTCETDRLQLLDMQETLDDFNETILEYQEYVYSKLERTLDTFKNRSSSTNHKHLE